MHLTDHFTLAELTATRTGLPNTPGDAEVAKLVRVAEMLEVIRAHFGRPIAVHSGYRSPQVNAAIGGSKTSQHMKAEAADFHVDGVPLVDVFDWIRKESGLAFGQVILEGSDPAHPTWCHLSLGEPYRDPSKCRQALRWDAVNGYRQV
ncbi:MAG TPA: D-Ala-D-Ala carboxypeptidase family metallohydrolase [Gemmatimonadales bacterium]|nr:D-Ala-D-Ala carboxypeptidase family metallohydrolase [Gemmatimonadales bacterium]